MGSNQSKTLKDSKKEILQKANFDVKKIKECYKDFKNSEYKNGITKEIFKKILSEKFKEADIDEICDIFFQAIDENGDGIIDFKEFALYMLSITSDDIEKKVEFLFNVCDNDGNGYITRNEFLKIVNGMWKANPELRKRYNSPQQVFATLFSLMDEDNDFKISLEEFRTSFQNNQEIALFFG